MLNQKQREMLDYLKEGSPVSPRAFRARFSLGDKSKQEQAYRDYLELSQAGYIKEDRDSVWITDDGLNTL